MRVLFVGMGSIGRRHCRNLAAIFVEEGTSFSFASLRSRRNPLPDDVAEWIDDEYYSWTDVPHDFDAIFITNPTSLHYETLKHACHMAPRIFIEKPVFSDCWASVEALHLPKESVHYVAAPLRYTKVFRFLKDFFASERKIQAVRAICSSYLPEWRPGTDYRLCHSARKEQGGDVGLELIHEWDYLTLMFGLPNSVQYLGRKTSNLEISSDDIALYLADYPDMVVSLWLDYFGRHPRREIEFYLPEDVMVGDFIRQEIRYLHSGKCISLHEERDDYQKEELRYFLSLRSDKENENTVAHAFDVLRLARGIIG